MIRPAPGREGRVQSVTPAFSIPATRSEFALVCLRHDSPDSPPPPNGGASANPYHAGFFLTEPSLPVPVIHTRLLQGQPALRAAPTVRKTHPLHALPTSHPRAS